MRLKSVKIELARGQVPRPARSLEGPGPQPSNAGQVVIAGRPGTVEVLTEGSWVERAVRWQPVDGLEMRVGGARLSTEDLVAVAEAVKLDRTTRCSAPLRLADVPAGARLLGCDAVYRATGSRYEATATLTVGDDAGAVEVAVRGGPAPAASWNASPTALPGGTTAGWVDEDTLIIFDFSGCQVDVTATGDYGHDEVAQVAQGLRRQGDLADPSTWPADPIG
jgi:hypothetical protein